MVFGSVRRMGRRLLSRHRPVERYLILIRVMIPEITEVMRDLATTFALSPSDRKMPHITLFGPFTLSEPWSARDVTECIELASEKSLDPRYSLDEMLELQGRKGKAIVRRVTFSGDLMKAYQEISSCLLPLAKCCTWLDREHAQRVVHITLAFNLPSELTLKVKAHLVKSSTWKETSDPEQTLSPGPGEYRVPGIAVLRNGMLWKEYDLARRTWRERKEIYPLVR
jgi:hypothetical protein